MEGLGAPGSLQELALILPQVRARTGRVSVTTAPERWSTAHEGLTAWLKLNREGPGVDRALFLGLLIQPEKFTQAQVAHRMGFTVPQLSTEISRLQRDLGVRTREELREFAGGASREIELHDQVAELTAEGADIAGVLKKWGHLGTLEEFLEPLPKLEQAVVRAATVDSAKTAVPSADRFVPAGHRPALPSVMVGMDSFEALVAQVTSAENPNPDVTRAALAAALRGLNVTQTLLQSLLEGGGGDSTGP